MLLEVISFCKAPRVWHSQQDVTLPAGWGSGEAGSFCPLLAAATAPGGMAWGFGLQQCLCAPEAAHTKLHVLILIFSRAPVCFFSHPWVWRCFQVGSWKVPSDLFDLFGTSFFKEKAFSVRKTQHLFTEEHISFYPSHTLTEQVSFVQKTVGMCFLLKGFILPISKVHNFFLWW